MTELPDTLLKSLYEHTSDAVFMVGANRRIQKVNPAFTALFGYTSGEINGVALSALYAEKSVFDASDGDPGAPELLYRTKSGGTFWGELRLIPTQREPRYLGIIRDVTKRRRLETRVQEGERLVREAVDSARQIAWRLNIATSTVTISGSTVEQFGLDPAGGSLPLSEWRSMIHPDDQPTCIAGVEDLLRGETIGIEYRIRTPSGDYRWVNSRGRLIDDASAGPIATGLIVDIHERKTLESQVEQSDRQLADALKAADLAAWRYDLKSHMSTIRGDLAHKLGVDQANPEISGPAWMERVHPDDVETVVSGTMAVAKGETEEFKVLYRARDLSGEWRWIRSTGRLIERDAAGNPLIAAGVLKDETVRIRLEMALEDEKDRYEAIYRATPAMLHSIDLDGRMIQVSDYWLEQTGYAREDVVGQISTDFLTPKSRAQCLEGGGLAEFWSDGECTNVPYDWVTKDGRVMQTLLSGVLEKNADGEPIQAHAVLVDVTERNALEHALREEKDRYESVYRATPALMHSIDAEGRIVDVSDHWLSTLEYDRDEVIGRSPTDFLTEPDRERSLTSGLEAHWKEGRCTNVPYSFVKKSGVIIETLLSAVVEENEDGAPYRSHAVFIDVTERNALESALREEKNRFEQIYQASPAMMHTIDAEGRITQVSDYWLAVMGYARREVIGRKSIEFLDSESRARALNDTLPSLFTTGSNTNIPYRFVRKNGEILDVLLSSFLERDDDGAPMASYAVLSDVTALRRAYDDLKRSNRELDRFAAIASHDLQEPLRKIAAFASLLNRRHRDSMDEEARRALHFMLDAAMRMQSLIDELLNYSRLSNQSLKHANVNLTDAAAEAISRLDSALGESSGWVCVGDLPVVQGDQSVLVQILQNLLSNAIKYRGKSAPRIHVECETDADTVTLSVRDNGIGFDPRFSEKIFAPFQRLHARGDYPGNGIGLAIVQQAVERHGGEVWVESAPGQGSTFYFSLPVPAAASASAAA